MEKKIVGQHQILLYQLGNTAVTLAAPVCCFKTKPSIPVMSSFKLTGGFEAALHLSNGTLPPNTHLSPHSQRCLELA